MSEPVYKRARLPLPDRAAFIERFGKNVTRGGIFLPRLEPLPKGTTMRFELQLKDGTTLLKGEGEVIWARPKDPDNPRKAYGISLKFRKLDKASHDLVLEIAERREASAVEAESAPRASWEPPPAASGEVADSSTGDRPDEDAADEGPSAAPAPLEPPKGPAAAPSLSERGLPPEAEDAEGRLTPAQRWWTGQMARVRDPSVAEATVHRGEPVVPEVEIDLDLDLDLVPGDEKSS